MDNLQYKNFINLISAYINQDHKDIKINEPNWNEIYNLAVLHNISGLIYSLLIDTKICDDTGIIEKFKKKFLLTISKSTIQERTTLQLLDILNKNKIRHIIFKGFVLRNYYPDKDVRTMGDIDIIIEPYAQERVHKILLDSGFEFDEAGSKQEVFNYKKNNVLFEIHTEIIKVSITGKTDFEKYFADNFKYAVNIKNLTYEFTKEHHFIYLITHLAKHFKFSGFGVRMLLDIPVFVNYFNSELDWDYIKKELNILGLYEFAGCILKICNRWFDILVPPAFDIKIKSIDIDTMENYIISGGVFGYNNRNIDVMRARDSSNAISRAANMIKLIFPSYEHITRRYVWAENMPKYLLPIIWIRVWIYRIFVIKENSFKRVTDGLKADKDAVEHGRLMKALNLK